MNTRRLALAGLAIFALQALVLHLYGQPAICACGYVKAWEGVVHSIGNSQHLADWYTFSHIIHGIAFFFLLAWLLPQRSVGERLVLALALEAGWELAENTPLVINFYREQALAAGYTGDSIINSLSDTLAMAAGFLFASRAPWWVSAGLVLTLELFVGYMIHDNLTLNILGFIHQFPAVEAWQNAAAPGLQ